MKPSKKDKLNELKESGNRAYYDANYDAALEHYKKAVQICAEIGQIEID